MLKMFFTFHDISTHVVEFNFTMLAQHQHGEIGKIYCCCLSHAVAQKALEGGLQNTAAAIF